MVYKQQRSAFFEREGVRTFKKFTSEARMKTFADKKRPKLYFGLGAVWLMLWFFNSFFNHQRTFALHALNDLWQAFYLVFVNFLFFEFSLPFILKKRQTILLNILIGMLLAAFHLGWVSVGLFAWNQLGMALGIFTQFRYTVLYPDNFYNRLLDASLYAAQTGIASVIFFGVAKLFHHNITLRQTAQQMQLEKQEAELNYLKAQTNPHFLFNTLNNIYALAREKSDLAPESILRLSKILRFMLYETNVEFICVEQELEIIRDYIALEKLRYDDSLRIDLLVEIENPKQSLPPLLLMPLIENAFKHGVAETSDQGFLDIQLIVKNKQLTFEVKNSAERVEEGREIKENIGLSNLRRQLQLLYSDYSLMVSRSATVFTATLKINLTSHV